MAVKGSFGSSRKEKAGVGEDVTERKKSEEALRENAEKYKFLVDNSEDFIFVISKTGRIVFANEKALATIGFTKKEVIGKSILSFLAKGSVKKALYALAQEFLGRPQREFEVEIKTKSGKTRTLELSKGSAFVHEKGKLIGILISAHDITEHKKEEEALKHSETFLNSIIEHSPHAMWISNDKGTMIRQNQACRDLLHISDDEVVGKYNVLQDNIVKEQGFLPQVKQVFEKGKTAKFLLRYDSSQLKHLKLTETASLILDVTISPVLDAKGRVTNAIIQHVDITERKNAEKALRESEEKYRKQFEEALDAIFIADAKTGTLVDCNHAACELVERMKSELIGKHQNILHPSSDTEGKFSRTFKQHLKEKEGQVLEARVITKKGKIKDVAIKANIFEIKGKKFLQGTFRDITTQKKAEEVLKESESRWRSLVMSLPEFISLIDKKGRIMFLNRYAKGFDEKKVIGTSVYQYISKDSLRGFRQSISQCFNTGRVQKGEHQAMGDLGRMRFYEDYFVPIIKGSSIKSAMVISDDVTERKRAEKALQDSEERFRGFFELSADLVVIADIDGYFRQINSAWPKLMGYSEKEILGRPFLDFVHPDDKEKTIQVIAEKLKRGDTILSFENRYVRKDGSVIWLEWTSRPQVEKGITFAIARDITEQKKAEEGLLKANAFNSAIVENAPFGIMTIRPDGVVDYINPIMTEISGTDKETFLGLNILKLPVYTKIGLIENINACFKGKPFFMGAVDYISHFGKKRTIRNFTGIPMRNALGKVDKVMLFVEDITKIKEAEEAILREKQFSDMVVDSIPGIFYLVDKKGYFVRLNKNISKVTGYSSEELLRFKATDIIAKEDRKLVADRIGAVFKKGYESVEAYLLTRDMSKIPYYFTGISTEIGDKAYLVGMGIDITDRKKTEKLTKESEEQSRLHAEETAILNKIIVIGNEAEDLQGLMKSTLDETLRLLSFSGGGIYLRNPDENIVKLAYSKGLDAEFVKAVREIDIRKKPFSIIFLKKEAIFTDDYASYHPDVAKKFNVASLASVPIFSRDEVTGALNVMSKKKHIFSDGEKRTLNAIGQAVGISIVNRLAEENLKSRTVELEKFNQMTIGRELRMVELKKRIKELEKKESEEAMKKK